MSKNRMYLCGVPEQHCVGGTFKVGTGYRGPRKGHSDRLAAFRCMVRYLKSQGYTQIGPREFAGPNGGPVRVLTKKSRYGGVLRYGKENNRFMHDNGTGTIVG